MLLLFFIISFLFGLTMILFKSKSYAKIMTILFVLIYIVFTAYAWLHLGETEMIYFSFDQAGVLMLLILSVVTATAVYHGFIYLKEHETRRYTIYHSAQIALVTAMTGAYLANGMTTVWIFVEATTLATAALIYHNRTSMALEATWKYIFVCSVGLALVYIGILFLGFTVGKGEILKFSFSSLTNITSQANPLYLKIAFVFVVVGYSTKMSLFPMHTVTVDAHTMAPPPASALISTALKNMGFLAIFRVYALFSHTSVLPFMNHVLIFSGMLSILVAAGYMLKAKHNLRMLAYSSMENMGIVAIAIGIGGIGYYAAFLLIVLHSFTKAGLFYQMGQARRVLGTYQLDESGNYIKLYPAGAAVLMLGLLCITAIPPSGLFISELLLFKAMVLKGNYIYLVFTVLILCFIVYALLTRVLHIVYSQPREQTNYVKEKVNPVQTISQFILFAVVIYLCFDQPTFLKDMINGIIQGLPK